MLDSIFIFHIKQYQDQPEIEKEVKRLFRMDNEAVDVKWEVIIEEENVANQQQVVLQGEASNADAKPRHQSSVDNIGTVFTRV